MALSESTISKIRRYGRTEAASHPDLEDWYNDAITDEDPITWGNLYEDAMAAKTAHLGRRFESSLPDHFLHFEMISPPHGVLKWRSPPPFWA